MIRCHIQSINLGQISSFWPVLVWKRKDLVESMFQKVRAWLALKNYQYQAITGIFMLEPWERMIFSILLISFNFPFNLSGLSCNVFDHALEMLKPKQMFIFVVVR